MQLKPLETLELLLARCNTSWTPDPRLHSPPRALGMTLQQSSGRLWVTVSDEVDSHSIANGSINGSLKHYPQAEQMETALADEAVQKVRRGPTWPRWGFVGHAEDAVESEHRRMGIGTAGLV